MRYVNDWQSPLGRITLASDGTSITGLWFADQAYYAACLSPEAEEKALPVFQEAKQWLARYFAGADPGQPPRLSLTGTPFRLRVWEILQTIPYGQTLTYGQISQILAREQGSPRTSARAVGGAVGHNPISLMVPCHRVVGAGGKLTGYAGGVERKEFLLRLEQNR